MMNRSWYPFFRYYGWREKKHRLDYPQLDGSGSGFWFRIFWGYGLHFTNGKMRFSERHGYEKFLRLPFGWRIKILTPE